MNFSTQLTSAIAIAVSIALTTPAMAAGKIENATEQQVKQAAANALSHAEQALASLKSGSATQDEIGEHISEARQNSKGIEVGRLDVKRNKAMSKLKDARTALTNNQNAEAETLLVDAIKLYKEIKDSI